MAKNILFFFPHNFFELKSGCHKRIYELMKYFKSRGFVVDFYSLENFENSWKDWDPQSEGLINELFLYDFSLGGVVKGKFAENRFVSKILAPILKKKVIPTDTISELYDFAFESMKKQFREILERKHYDFVVITYTFWARLLDDNVCKGSTTVLEMQDFLSLNLFDSCAGKVKIGNLLEEEINRVNLFDKVLCISEEERSFFSRFAKKPEYFYTPLSLPGKTPAEPEKADYDILFIGSGNPHNQAGIAWFFKSVYPLLDRKLKIAIVGEITKYIDRYQNVVSIDHVEDINDVYPKSRVSICPLLGGTGLKIKVVEALSYGVPVVTTSYGITGFITKVNSGCCVTDDPGEFAGYVTKLLEDKAFYGQQRNLALSFFLENFEESHVYSLLDAVFSSKSSSAEGNSGHEKDKSNTDYNYQMRDNSLDFDQGVAMLKEIYPERVFVGYPNITYSQEDNERLLGEIKKRNIAVKRLRIDHREYSQYLDEANYREKYPNYYDFNFHEKALEHHVAFKLLKLREGENFIDIAAENSPHAEIFGRLTGCNGYKQDIMFKPGIHKNRIGSDASKIPIKDGFFQAALAACSIEHFENSTDTLFICEISRLLGKGGRVVIIPLYLHDMAVCITDPRYSVPGGVRFDDEVDIHCVQGWGNRHGRYYSPDTLNKRLIEASAGKLNFTVVCIDNFKEIDQSVYCRFALFGERI